MKPKMDMSSYTAYNPPANIIYYNHLVSMYYSSVVSGGLDRISYCLNKKIVMYSGMNLETLGTLIGSKLQKPLTSYTLWRSISQSLISLKVSYLKFMRG